MHAMHKIIILTMNTDIIIARAANKRGKLLPYCIAFWDYLNHSVVCLYLRLNTQSDSFTNQCMKTKSSHHSEHELVTLLS